MSIEKLNSEYGDIASSGEEYERAEFIPTGIRIFDGITGGGFACGHMTEIHGLEGCGKTTVCLQGVASAQKLGKSCVWVDAERRFNPQRAQELGIDLKRLVVIRPKFGEQACAVMLDLIREKKTDLIVLDSLPSLSPRNEMEAEESGPIGGQARMWSTFIRKAIVPLSESPTAFVVVNQMRSNLTAMQNPYSPEASEPYTYPGGKAQRYHASTRVEVKKGKTYKEGDLPKGFYVKFRNVKTSFIQPFLAAETILFWDRGFSSEADTFEEAVKKGVITKKGNSFFYGEMRLGVGVVKARDALKQEELLAEIKQKLSSAT